MISYDRFAFARSVLLVLLIMMLAGWAAAGTPMQGDQALFLVGAKQLAEGEVLYRDFWDVTNPGIYLVYFVAGKCFGYTDDGIHLFEWLYWLAFVMTACELFRRHHSLTAWPLSPAFLIGVVYYWPSCSDASQLTKVEGFVAFPMFLAVWFGSRLTPRTAVLAGLAGGFVLLFKFLFGVCLAVAWSYLLLVHIRRQGWRSAMLSTCGLIGGVLTILVPVVLYFTLNGASAIAFETIFVDPRKMLAEVTPAEFERMVKLVRWGLEIYTPAFAAALLGGWFTLRRRHDPFLVAYGLVVLSSFVVIFVQRWSWWTYHILLVGTPSCVLAAYTLPELDRRCFESWPSRDRTVAIVCGLICFLSVIGHGVRVYVPLLTHRFGWKTEDRLAIKMAVGRQCGEAKTIAAWLNRPNAKPGAVYVCGDPLVYLWANRRQAIPIHGWSMELYHTGTRARLAEQIRTTRPAYIFLDRTRLGVVDLVKEKYPEFHKLLEAQYTPQELGDVGTWYERRDLLEN